MEARECLLNRHPAPMNPSKAKLITGILKGSARRNTGVPGLPEASDDAEPGAPFEDGSRCAIHEAGWLSEREGRPLEGDEEAAGELERERWGDRPSQPEDPRDGCPRCRGMREARDTGHDRAEGA